MGRGFVGRVSAAHPPAGVNNANRDATRPTTSHAHRLKHFGDGYRAGVFDAFEVIAPHVG